ncbi:SDR family NAD(P)-dependent oxidoreductase [Pelagibius sp. Alg239-R121]|uniref:SDR family NAD(P)-dependent oxidoreductase n=1 Tax=Pelagibius sp. Alg239-R121 TaxID=2993448 RepID=UPI0024A78477|nr:SDR family NAD(P)-dependent oxidoreductase [Pelagibius sp. Alg239-R121]
MTEKVAVVTGVGPGLGASLCRRLHRAGYKVGGLARSGAFGKELESELGNGSAGSGSAEFKHFSCDLAEPTAVRETIQDVEHLWGAPDVLIHNASQILIKPFVEITAKEFEAVWRVTCLGGMTAAKAVVPGMQKKGGGAILFTGATAALRGGAKFAAFASAKFALRGLAQSLAREHGADGIHVAHVVIDGLIWSEKTVERFDPERDACLEPDAIAESYYQLIGQDRSAWSQEIDLRPFSEKF